MLKSKWLKFSILYLGAIILSISQMKISPTLLRDAFIDLLGITEVHVSIYVSIFAFAPVFLAIPGGGLVKKFGAKKISILIMIALFVGNLLGYLSNSFPVMIAARVIEGISFSFIMITGMVLITNWFKDGGYGIAVGIFGTFSAFGYAAVIYLLPMVYGQTGLKGIWLVLAIASAVLGICFILFFDDPRSQTDPNLKRKKVSLGESFRNPKLIRLAISMCTLSFVLFTFLDKYPTIFKDVYQLERNASSLNSMLFGLLGIPAGFLIGFLIEKTGKPITIGFFAFIVMAVACFMTDKTPTILLILQVTALSTCISFTSTTISSSVPNIVKRPELLEDSFAIVYLFYYIGALIGIPIVSGLMENFGWGWAVLPLTVVSLLGAFLIAPLVKKEKEGIPLNSDN